MKFQRNFTILLIPILILTIVWVGSNVYHSSVDSTIDIPTKNSIIPIKGVFDQETIASISARTKVDPLNEILPKVSIAPEELEATPSSDLDLDFEEDGVGTESALNEIENDE